MNRVIMLMLLTVVSSSAMAWNYSDWADNTFNGGQRQARDKANEQKRLKDDASNARLQQEYAPKNANCKQAILKSVTNPHTVSFTSAPHAPHIESQWDGGQYYGKTELGAEYGYFTFYADLGDGSYEHAVHCYLDSQGRVIDLRTLPVQPRH